MIETFVQPLMDWVALYPNRAGFIVFLIAMIESLVIVGVLVPGAALLFGVGALIGTGTLELWPTLAWAAAGAIAGDGISFWLGYHYREQLHHIWPFKNHPKLFSRGEVFFHKHGGKSIAFGRFVGPIRAIVPTVAGMMAMSPLRFTIINVLSALAWAPVYILPGAAFGTSLELASDVMMHLISLLIVIALFIWLVAWSIKKVFIKVPRNQRLPVAIALLIPVGLIFILYELPKAPDTIKQTISFTTWQNAPPTTQPATSIQWIGSVTDLENKLKSSGWQVPESLNLTSVFLLMTHDSPISQLPVWNQRGRSQLILVAPDDTNKQRLVLQLWPTQTTVMMPSGKTEILWTGNISSQTMHSIWPVLNLPLNDSQTRPFKIESDQILFKTVKIDDMEVTLLWNSTQEFSESP
ncbi:MAG TPA: DedA family protein [Gammaproteobacteria bacterium]|nr:DedA family protein [Gammaproteobacteria bacterium]